MKTKPKKVEIKDPTQKQKHGSSIKHVRASLPRSGVYNWE